VVIGTANSAPIPRLSYEEFLRAYMGSHAEWIDGEVILIPSDTLAHQRTMGFLLVLLSWVIEEKNAGRLLHRFQMKTGPDLPGREPDLAYVAPGHIERVRETFINGPADLVVEIVSPESRGRDRGDKFYEYEKGGVREHWLIDPERRTTEFYVLGDDGLFHGAGPDRGVYRSVVVEGLSVKVDWFWKIPPLREALAELGLP